MKAFAEEQGITYPLAIDSTGATAAAFAVDSFPDYYLLDRSGKVRFADLANGELDRAIEMLLAEKAPSAHAKVDLTKVDAQRVLSDALTQAKASNRRVLIHFGGPG